MALELLLPRSLLTKSQSRKKRRTAELVKHKKRFERGYARDVAKEFRTQATIASARFIADGEDAACREIRKRVPTLSRLLAANNLRVAEFFVTSLRRYFDTLPGSKAERPKLTNDMRRFIEKHSFKRAEDISKNTVNKLRKIVVDGVSKRHATSTIAKDINKVIDNPARAKAIARTEVHTAASYSQEKEAESYGAPMVREWATAGDENVRPTHAAADGQRRKMGKPFRVGGHSLMYPGDPSGPAEEIINCRCVLLYEPDNDEI